VDYPMMKSQAWLTCAAKAGSVDSPIILLHSG
jgi:hypothetical protein